MIRSFWIIVSICLLPILLSAQESDSIRIRQITTGVYGHIESTSQNVFSSNTGYGIEVGAYQERKLLGKVGLTYGAGFGTRSYDDFAFLIDTTPDTDTTIIDFLFQTSHQDLKFTTGIAVKFEYIDNPKIYLMVGLGPEIIIRQQVNATYQQTRYLGIPDETTNVREILRTSTNEPPANFTDDDFRNNVLSLRFDIGFGIELKKFNIEIVNRTNNIQGIGIRLKYKFDTLVY